MSATEIKMIRKGYNNQSNDNEKDEMDKVPPNKLPILSQEKIKI